MEHKITITASDGRVFTGIDYNELLVRVSDHEDKLELKRVNELEERRKAEEINKAREEIHKKTLEEINSDFNNLRGRIDKYESVSGKKLIAKYQGDSENIDIIEVRNTLDFAFDLPMERLLGVLLGR